MARLIGEARAAEVEGVRHANGLRAANESIYFVAPLLQGFATFAIHVSQVRLTEIAPNCS